jgi:hypothetical protein
MNKSPLNKLSLKNLSKGGGTSVKLPKGLKPLPLGLAVVCVILLALAIYFAFSYSQGINTKDSLTKDIAQTEKDIANHPLKNISELQAKLEDVVANISQNTPFQKSVDDTELATQVLGITKYFAFTPASGLSDTIVGVNSYSVKSYAIACGTAMTFPKIIYFLKNLEGLPYTTSQVTGLNLVKSGDSWTFSLKFQVILQKQ